MTHCTCHPGTETNGWHEIRCFDCLMVEREQMQRAISRQMARVEYQLKWLDYRLTTSAS